MPPEAGPRRQPPVIARSCPGTRTQSARTSRFVRWPTPARELEMRARRPPQRSPNGPCRDGTQRLPRRSVRHAAVCCAAGGERTSRPANPSAVAHDLPTALLDRVKPQPRQFSLPASQRATTCPRQAAPRPGRASPRAPEEDRDSATSAPSTRLYLTRGVSRAPARCSFVASAALSTTLPFWRVQQRDFGSSRGRIHRRPVTDASDRFGFPTAAQATIALRSRASWPGASAWPRHRSSSATLAAGVPFHRSPTWEAELPEDARDKPLNGPRTSPDPFCDLLVVQPATDQPQYLELSRR